MISYLAEEPLAALRAGGDAPMLIVDPTTQRVYYVVYSGLMPELKCSADLEAIRHGITDMQTGH